MDEQGELLGDRLRSMLVQHSESAVESRFKESWNSVVQILLDKASKGFDKVFISYKILGLDTLTYLDAYLRKSTEQLVLNKIQAKCAEEHIHSSPCTQCDCDDGGCCRCLPNGLEFHLSQTHGSPKPSD